MPEGFDALLLSNLAREAAMDAGSDTSGKAGEPPGPTPLLHICRDDTRLRSLAGALAFFAGDIEVLKFPAWDCLPYDRVSPNPVVVAARMGTLAELAAVKTRGEPRPRPRILLSTVNALLQRLPARDLVRENFFEARVGQDVDSSALIEFLTREGYLRSGQVSEPGEFAVRGGLIDIFPTAEADPVRLDLFGDRLDAIRIFDALSQLSTGQRQHLRLLPANEFIFDQAGIGRFRKAYHANFGANTDDDPLYGAVSAGRRHQGMEHWLPLFHDHMETLFDYLPQPLVTMDFDCEAAIKARFELIRDYFEARTEARQLKTGLGEVYKPLAPEQLYLGEDELEGLLAKCRLRQFSPLKAPPSPRVLEMPARPGRDFAPERQSRSEN
ncbi:MAG: transcription-repair coupling factor, partial [Sphingomonadales bacterium]